MITPNFTGRKYRSLRWVTSLLLVFSLMLGAAQQITLAHALDNVTISGYITDYDVNPLENVTVQLLGTSIPAVLTNADGYYEIPNVPPGHYDIQAGMERCTNTYAQPIDTGQGYTYNFTLAWREDPFGYRCQVLTFDWVEGIDVLDLTGTQHTTAVELPFAFELYGEQYSTAYVSTSGFLNFHDHTILLYNDIIPNGWKPNAAIYPFWDELNVTSDSAVKTAVVGDAPNRIWVLEYENVAFYETADYRLNFELKLHESTGLIDMLYKSMRWHGNGESATIGIENEDGTLAFLYSYYEPAIHDGLALQFQPPRFGFVQGTVTDAVDGAPLEGVKIQAFNSWRYAFTDANGQYRLIINEGVHMLEASYLNYVPEEVQIHVGDHQTVVQDFALAASRATISPTSLTFDLLAGDTNTQSLTIANTGQADLTFHIAEQSVPPEDFGGTQGRVALFIDAVPVGDNPYFALFDAMGIPWDAYESPYLGAIDLSQYEAIFIPSDQTVEFYEDYNANFARIEEYVRNGGFLWVSTVWGMNGGNFLNSQLPGGITIDGGISEIFNTVTDPDHPTMEGVPNPFRGSAASGPFFPNVPDYVHVIAMGQQSGMPTLIEYEYGAGRVLAFAQYLEWGYQQGEDAGRILENSIAYANSFEPFADVPWLSVDIASGTIPPGGSQSVQVNVDASGLTPGSYEAKLILVPNDPYQLAIEVPVTLTISEATMYTLAVNAGGGEYIDLSGNVWSADQMYQPGSWGYVGKSKDAISKKPISGTDDDALYQSQRQRMDEYRFDGLAPGMYQVELYFAELKNTQPGKHLFDVMLESEVVLSSHDIVAETGTFTADTHTFTIEVIDGTLNIQFLAQKDSGEPVINALRITQQPSP